MAEENIQMAARTRGPKAIPAGYAQTERKVATLYPPVDPSMLTGLLGGSGPMGFPGGYPGMPFREVRVRLGKLEVWEKTPER
jgi:hypothetical protein